MVCGGRQAQRAHAAAEAAGAAGASAETGACKASTTTSTESQTGRRLLKAGRIEAGSVHQHHARLHTCVRELLLPPTTTVEPLSIREGSRGYTHAHARCPGGPASWTVPRCQKLAGHVAGRHAHERRREARCCSSAASACCLRNVIRLSSCIQAGGCEDMCTHVPICTSGWAALQVVTKHRAICDYMPVPNLPSPPPCSWQ